MSPVMDPTLKPMLCTAVDVVPEGDDWVAEGKFDGWRVVAHVTGGSWNGVPTVKVYGGRNSSDYSGTLPYIEQQLAALLPPNTVVDGEMIGGDFGDVQSVMRTGGAHDPRDPKHRLTYVIFDVLRINGQDARKNPWTDRRAVLERLGLPSGNVHLSITAPSNAQTLEQMLKLGLEGVVCKRRSSTYVGARASSWVKVKPQDTTEAEIIGFDPGKGRLVGQVGAFKVRLLDTGAETTVKCGTDSVHQDATDNPERWLGTIIELKHHGFQQTGKVRHPQFLRRRDDRSAAVEAAATASGMTPRQAQIAALKAGPGEAPASKPRQAPKPKVVKTGGASGRNYGAMLEQKLRTCIDQLRARSGDAYERCVAKNADPEADLAVAEAALAAKGKDA